MTSSRSSLALIALTLLGCGDHGPEQGLDLQGTWHYQSVEDRSALVGRHIIEQRGDDVIITDCRRQTYALKIRNGVLIDPRGFPYYLQPVDSEHLVGTGDLGTRSQVVKTSNQIHFDSGSLSFSASGMDNLIAHDNVCAEARPGRVGASDGSEVAVRTVVLTAPYHGSFVLIVLAFKSLESGSYSVMGIDPFVHTDAGATYLTIESPAVGNALGGDGFALIASGMVQMTVQPSGQLLIRGSATTENLKTISFSATVSPIR